MPAWLILAWGWLKKNWKSVLLGVGTLGIGLLVGRTLKKPPKVVNPELVDHEEARKKAEEDALRKMVDAELERDKRLAELEREHEETIKKLTDEQRAEAYELEEDPEALNDYLLRVGGTIGR